MPRSPTNKSSKKAKGKVPAARRRASPWNRTDPLFSGPGMKDPTWLHRLAIALLALYASKKFKDDDWIPLQDIMEELEKYLTGLDTLSGHKSRLRNVRDALSSFEDKGYLEWDGLQNDNELKETIRLTPLLQPILAHPLKMIQSQMSNVDLSALTPAQHRSLGMWFRGRLGTNELGLRNLTKHDWRKANDALKKSAARANSAPSALPHASNVEDADVDTDHNMDLSSSNKLPNQNATAGPSQSIQTPTRSRTLNSAHAYPTPDSHPRARQSGIYNNAAQAGPRIPALNLDLPTPAYTESEGEDNQDATEMDGVAETPLMSRELEYQQQIKDLFETIAELREKNRTLENENIVLRHSMEILEAQLEKERRYLCKKLQERRCLQAVENAKWKLISFWWRGRNSRIEQLNNEIAAARADIACHKIELDNLKDSVRRKDANIAALQQTVADQSEQFKSQMLELNKQLKAEKDAKEKVQKELEKKQGLLTQVRKTEAGLRIKLENFKADKLVDLNVLKLSHARYNALFQRLRQECTQMRKEVDDWDQVIKDYEDAQKRNQEAMATFHANYVVVSPR